QAACRGALQVGDTVRGDRGPDVAAAGDRDMRLPFFNRTRRDADLEDEIRLHLAMAQAERVARGESADDAAFAARREFGNVVMVKEITREQWGAVWLERTMQDLRYALRSLRRAP